MIVVVASTPFGPCIVHRLNCACSRKLLQTYVLLRPVDHGVRCYVSWKWKCDRARLNLLFVLCRTSGKPRRSSDVETMWELRHGDHVRAPTLRSCGGSDVESMWELRHSDHVGAPTQWPCGGSDVESMWELRREDHLAAWTRTVDWFADMTATETTQTRNSD